MPILADCHLHSCHSGDSDTPMEEQVRAAIRRGLTSLCFTEHCDAFFPYEMTPDLAPGTFELDLSSYRKEFLELREQYEGKIRLLCGIELGIQPHLGSFLRQYAQSLKADFPELDLLIGSCHLCYGMDPYYPAFLEGHTEEEALCAYFSDTLEDIRAFPEVDTWGHLDYLVRCLPRRSDLYTYTRFADFIDPILMELILRDIALEVNTAPLARGFDFLHPLPDILRRYRELGGALLTIGSDAHVPEGIAAGFGQAAEVLKSLGFTQYAVFESRKPVLYPL